MANGLGTPSYSEEKGRGGYAPSLWTTVYTGSVSATFDTNISADSAEEYEITVTGAALGDHVVVIPQGGDPEPSDHIYYGVVSAADTVQIGVHASSAAHPAAVTSFKFAVLRPNW